MSYERFPPFDLEGVSTYPLASRASKVKADEFAQTPKAGASFAEFYQALPDILGSKQLKLLVDRIVDARKADKPVILGMGAHVIKVGLTPIVCHLMDQGWVTAIAMNGAGIVHDFEIAYSGATSEDVDAALGSGNFGMAEETGRMVNQAIRDGVERGDGLGRSMGRFLNELKPAHLELSVLAAAERLNQVATIHVAIGTDIVHMHPAASGAALGEGSHRDFRTFVSMVSQLGGGGVYINMGSAVLLPEVFLKAVTLVKNRGIELKNFTTANIDFIQHYRPLTNVVRRPTAAGAGTGISITGHHEILLPLMAFALEEQGTNF